MILYLIFKKIEQNYIVLHFIYVLEILKYEHHFLFRWCILGRKMVNDGVA